MKVVILCGGKGIRIRDISDDLPKPMIPINGVPIIHHIMNIYSHYNFNDFVLCLGHKGWKIKEYFCNLQYQLNDITLTFANSDIVVHNDCKMPPWTITLSDTGLDSMTGCRLKQVQKYINDETFMLSYGDCVSDINIQSLVDFHYSHGKLVTVTSVRPLSRFGKMTIIDNSVVNFQEKPQISEGSINGGFFVCKPEVFEYVTTDIDCVWEGSALNRLANDGELCAYNHDGFWMPMDTTREYMLLNNICKNGNVPWRS